MKKILVIVILIITTLNCLKGKNSENRETKEERVTIKNTGNVKNLEITQSQKIEEKKDNENQIADEQIITENLNEESENEQIEENITVSKEEQEEKMGNQNNDNQKFDVLEEEADGEISKEKNNNDLESYENNLIDKMKPLEEELQPDFDSGISANMRNAAIKLDEAWDIELNKVYKDLMNKLPESEKIKLRNSERKWIVERDKKLEMLSDEDGTSVNVMKSGMKYQLTKERTLILAKVYDKLSQ